MREALADAIVLFFLSAFPRWLQSLAWTMGLNKHPPMGMLPYPSFL